MKIIDLLNKIAKKEKVPEHIKYNDTIFEYNYKYHLYKSIYSGTNFIAYIDENNLNDEVELPEVELPKEDKKIKRIEERESGWWPNMADGNVSTLKQAINEIIDRLNGEDNDCNR